jgi:hypothetical protein
LNGRVFGGHVTNNVASTRKRAGFIMVLNSGYSSVLEKRLLSVVVSPFLFLTAWLYRCLHNSNAWSAQPVIEGTHFLVVKIWTVQACVKCGLEIEYSLGAA